MTQVDWAVSVDAWRDMLTMCPEATFYHTPEWYSARQATTGVALKPVMFRFDGGQIREVGIRTAAAQLLAGAQRA